MPATTFRFGNVYVNGPSQIRRAGGGWVGSVAGAVGDLVTVNADGRIAQAVAAGSNVAAGTRVARLVTPIASSATAGTSVDIQILDDSTLIELQAVDGSGAGVATNLNMIGDLLEVKRLANGNYTADTAATANAKVEVVGISPRYPIGELGGTLIVKVLPAQRIN